MDIKVICKIPGIVMITEEYKDVHVGDFGDAFVIQKEALTSYGEKIAYYPKRYTIIEKQDNDK